MRHAWVVFSDIAMDEARRQNRIGGVHERDVS